MKLHFPDFTRNKILLLSGLTKLPITQSFLPYSGVRIFHWKQTALAHLYFRPGSHEPHILSQLQLCRLSAYSFHLLIATSLAVSLPLCAGGWACHQPQCPEFQRPALESFQTSIFGPKDGHARKYSPNGWVPSITLFNGLKYFLIARSLSRQLLIATKPVNIHWLNGHFSPAWLSLSYYLHTCYWPQAVQFQTWPRTGSTALQFAQWSPSQPVASWDPLLWWLHSWLQTWSSWYWKSSVDTLRATQGQGSTGFWGHGSCLGSAVVYPFLWEN